MKFKALILSIFILIIQLTAVLSSPIDIESFYKFDSVYIPALFYTNQENKTNSNKAFNEFLIVKNQMDSFLSDFLTVKEKSHLDRQIEKAKEYISSNELKLAHKELEEIRYILKDGRENNNLIYFLDYLNEFHEYMEGFILSAPQDAAQRERFLYQMKELLSKMNEFAEEADLTEKFNLPNRIKQEKVKSFIKNELQIIDQLIHPQDIYKPELSNSLKQNFVQVYKLFGDFNDFK